MDANRDDETLATLKRGVFDVKLKSQNKYETENFHYRAKIVFKILLF